MSKVRWKRTRGGIRFIEKKTLSEKLGSISFMQAALALFVLELLLFLFCVIYSAFNGGNAGYEVTLIGYAIILLAAAGISVTCYGHYNVEAESRLPWKLGIYTNGGVIAGMVILFIAGLFL